MIPFPFTDLSQAKRRPALALASLPGSDLILAQITSQQVADNYAVPVLPLDFEVGSLNRLSNVRPNRLFTADQAIVLYSVGRLKREKVMEVAGKVVEILIGT